MIIARPYSSADLQAVISVFYRSVREVASHDYSPAQIAAWTPEPINLDAWGHRLASGGVFVCESDHQIVGFARINEPGYIDLLYVHPKFQRQGVARALFEQMIIWASHQGLCCLTAEVSITARQCFECFGFRVVHAQAVERQGIQLQNFQMECGLNAR